MLEHVKTQVKFYGALLGAPDDRLPTFDAPRGDATPFIEARGGLLHFVVSERGVELERRTTGDADELLYWVFRDIAFGLASEWECTHRRANEDFRRQLFARHEELLAVLSLSWARRCSAEHARTLEAHPFVDG